MAELIICPECRAMPIKRNECKRCHGFGQVPMSRGETPIRCPVCEARETGEEWLPLPTEEGLWLTAQWDHTDEEWRVWIALYTRFFLDSVPLVEKDDARYKRIALPPNPPKGVDRG